MPWGFYDAVDDFYMIHYMMVYLEYRRLWPGGLPRTPVEICRHGETLSSVAQSA